MYHVVRKLFERTPWLLTEKHTSKLFHQAIWPPSDFHCASKRITKTSSWHTESIASRSRWVFRWELPSAQTSWSVMLFFPALLWDWLIIYAFQRGRLSIFWTKIGRDSAGTQPNMNWAFACSIVAIICRTNSLINRLIIWSVNTALITGYGLYISSLWIRTD